jgi:hypothetical protein
VAELEKTLAVDPEDLEAHYNLMLCYRGLNNDALAAREEKLYLRFKADESSRAITGPYKLKSPQDNNEAQPIHEHGSVALVGKEGSKQKAEGRKPYAERRMQDVVGEPSGLPQIKKVEGPSPSLHVTQPSPGVRGWSAAGGPGEGQHAELILNHGDKVPR